MGYARVEVASDSMRVGKTTAVDVIVQGLGKKGINAVPSYEDWQNNPFLRQSYDEDPHEAFLKSQEWFAQRKHAQLSAKRESAVVQDVTPEMDYCYALTNYKLGRMSDPQFKEYRDFYLGLGWGSVSLPHVLLYLAVSDAELIRRATISLREFEKVDEKYLLTMKAVNRGWLENAPERYRERILLIKGDRRNFAHSKVDQRWLVNQVARRLGL